MEQQNELLERNNSSSQRESRPAPSNGGGSGFLGGIFGGKKKKFSIKDYNRSDDDDDDDDDDDEDDDEDEDDTNNWTPPPVPAPRPVLQSPPVQHEVSQPSVEHLLEKIESLENDKRNLSREIEGVQKVGMRWSGVNSGDLYGYMHWDVAEGFEMADLTRWHLFTISMELNVYSSTLEKLGSTELTQQSLLWIENELIPMWIRLRDKSIKIPYEPHTLLMGRSRAICSELRAYGLLIYKRTEAKGGDEEALEVADEFKQHLKNVSEELQKVITLPPWDILRAGGTL